MTDAEGFFDPAIPETPAKPDYEWHRLHGSWDRPGDGEWVLVHQSKGQAYRIAEYRPYEGVFIGRNPAGPLQSVTHWMRLPPLPED